MAAKRSGNCWGPNPRSRRSEPAPAIPATRRQAVDTRTGFLTEAIWYQDFHFERPRQLRGGWLNFPPRLSPRFLKYGHVFERSECGAAPRAAPRRRKYLVGVGIARADDADLVIGIGKVAIRQSHFRHVTAGAVVPRDRAGLLRLRRVTRQASAVVAGFVPRQAGMRIVAGGATDAL